MNTTGRGGRSSRFVDWVRWWNPLAHGFVVALGLDFATDALWGNGTVNLIVFVTTFIAVTAGSMVGQRRQVKRIEAQRPLTAGTPVDRDGTPLVVVLAPDGGTDALEGGTDAPDGEWLWARPLDNGLYRLRSVPVVTEGLARNDIVSCANVNWTTEVHRLVERGGHRTIHLTLARVDVLDEDNDRATTGLPRALSKLPLGESLVVQGTTEGRFVIDVHPEDDYAELTASLDALERSGILTWRTTSTTRGHAPTQ